MPKRKYSGRVVRRTRRRIGRYKRRRKYRRKYTVQRGIGVSKAQVVTMRYCDTINLTAGAAVPVQYLLRANSIFDPDYTGTGHQPISHDQWSQWYHHYTVVGSKCYVTANTTSGVSTQNLNIGLGVVSAVPVNMDLNTTKEQGNYQIRLIQGTDKSVRLSKGYSPKKEHTIANIRDNIDTLGAMFGANPTEDTYFHIWMMGNYEQGTAMVTVAFTVIFRVLLTERKRILGS